MSAPIEFWFDFSSPYAYFASEVVEQFGLDAGHAIQWRPFLLGAIFPKTSMAPLAKTPMRGDYARHDWQRIARLLNVPFMLPASHPFAAIRPSRAYYWVEANAREHAEAFAHGIFRAHFVSGKNPNETAELTAIAIDCGLDSDRLLVEIEIEPWKTHLRERTDEAASRGIFGSPFFIFDGEPFWGWDRMPMMRDWIERGGW